MTDPLTSLGWDAEWRRAYDLSAPPADASPGRVARVDRGRFTVLTDAGSVRAGAELPPGAVEDRPTTGDWVVVDGRVGADVVVTVLPRRSRIVRSSAGRRSEGHLIAANVDLALIAVPLDAEPRLNQVERFLTVAWESGARPVVVLTKGDLAPDAEAARLRVQEAAPGADVLTVSAETGVGLDALRDRLAHRTTAVLGRSGAGKSTLVNALLGVERMATQEIRTDGKGRHTTVTRELLVLPGGGVLIDTPGLRGVGVHEAVDGLARSFADVESLAAQCHFGDCSHESEPGCAVRAAIASGALTMRRLESYRKQQREVEWERVRNDPAARSALVRKRSARRPSARRSAHG